MTHATPQFLQQHLHDGIIRDEGAAAREVKGPPRNETAASLSVLSRRAGARADTRWAGTTTARAISPTEALPTDELRASAVTDVLVSGGIEGGTTGGGRRRGCGCVVVVRSAAAAAGGLLGRASASEAAALLAVLERGTWAGADAVGEGAATAGAVGVGETLAGDELSALAVADFIGAVRVEGRLSDDGGREGEESGDGDENGLHDDDDGGGGVWIVEGKDV